MQIAISVLSVGLVHCNCSVLIKYSLGAIFRIDSIEDAILFLIISDESFWKNKSALRA